MNRAIKDATIKTYPYDHLQMIKPGPRRGAGSKERRDREWGVTCERQCDMREDFVFESAVTY
jgi:hypothetical protein